LAYSEPCHERSYLPFNGWRFRESFEQNQTGKLRGCFVNRIGCSICIAAAARIGRGVSAGPITSFGYWAECVTQKWLGCSDEVRMPLPRSEKRLEFRSSHHNESGGRRVKSKCSPEDRMA